MNPTLKVLREWIPDALMIAGVACLAYGAGRIYAPAAWLVSGTFTFAFGFQAARRSSDS